MKSKNTKKRVIKKSDLLPMEQLLVDTILYTYDNGYSFATYYKKDIQSVPGLKNLSWENIITLGKENIAVMIDALKATLNGAAIKVTNKVYSTEKTMRPLPTTALKNKYEDAIKKLQLIAAKAEYKPLLPWFRTSTSYTDDMLMMSYSDILGYWDICAIKGWHAVMLSMKGYRYIPSDLRGVKKGALHRDNYSLFIPKESNKLISREEIAWFETHGIDTAFIKLWFDTSNDLGSLIKESFQTVEEFMETVTNNGAPDEEFSIERHQIAHNNYTIVKAQYQAA